MSQKEANNIAAVIFQNCKLLTGEGELHVEPNMSVTVDGGRIQEVSPRAAAVKNAKIIDLGGRYLMPGLINLHVHLPGNGNPAMVSKVNLKKKDKEASDKPSMLTRSMESGLVHKALRGMVKRNLITTVNSGVTTVRSVGELYWTDLENRNAMQSGRYVGPRLLVCGTGVSVPEGHMAGTMAAVCRTEDDARKAVRTAIDRGVDWIKLFVTGGVLDASDTGEPARLRMPYELAKAACDLAHSEGLWVCAHAESSEGVRVSLRAGVDSIEHGGVMDDEIAELYRKNGSSATLTISPAIAIAELPEALTGMNETQRTCGRTAMEGMIEGARQALRLGIPLGLGTDASCPFVTHYDFWRELYYFAKYCGVSNGAALYTATMKNAEILRLGELTGSVTPGKAADLLVTDENPLTNLRALQTPSIVMAGGNLIEKPKVKRN